MTLFAKLVSEMEGFNIPGSVPARNNNPGDLRHSPHSQHPGGPNSIGVIDSLADGWDDLERQLRLYASSGLTVRQTIETFAPPNENDTLSYLKFVLDR